MFLPVAATPFGRTANRGTCAIEAGGGEGAGEVTGAREAVGGRRHHHAAAARRPPVPPS